MRVDADTRRLALEALGEAPGTLEYNRVATRMGIPVATLRSWVCRARKEAGVKPPRKPTKWRPVALQRDVQRNATEPESVATRCTDPLQAGTKLAPVPPKSDMPNPVTPKQAEVAAAMAEGKTWREIQASTGVSHTTLANWMKDLGFRAYLRELREAGTEAIRARLDGLRHKAVDAVVELTEEADRDSTRLAAATTVLDRTGHGGKSSVAVDVTPHQSAPAIDLTTPEGEEQVVAMLSELPLDLLQRALGCNGKCNAFQRGGEWPEMKS